MGKFCLLFKKNLKTTIRLWYKFLIEILIIIAVFLIIYINPIERYENAQWNVENTKVDFLEEQDLNSFKTLETFGDIIKNMNLVFTPKSEYAKLFARNIVEKFKMKTAVGYKNEYLMTSQFNPEKTLAGIVFPEGENPPDNFTVVIRFPSTFRTLDLDDASEMLWTTRCGAGDELADADEDLYIREGFLQLQTAIFQEFIQYKVTPPPETDKSRPILKPYLLDTPPICLYLSESNYELFLFYFVFLYTFLRLISRYGREMEENLQVHHWKYRIRYYTHWCAHFWESMLRLFFLDLLIFFALKVKLFEDESAGTLFAADPGFLLLFLLLYNISMIVFAIFIVCIIRDRINAMLVGFICWIASYSFFSIILERTNTMNSYPILGCCVVFFNNFLGFGLSYMRRMDAGVTNSGEFPIIFIAIGINIVLYLFLIWMVQMLNPGLYIFRSFDCCGLKRLCRKIRRQKKKPKTKIVTLAGPTPSWNNFEYGPLGGQDYVKIKNVCTYYKNNSGVQLLKNVSMRIFKGEITVLLGSHGAGKTTLIKVLAGLLKPNTGTVRFMDEDLYENWKKTCSQYDFAMGTNPIFNYLTVEETIMYFIRIKMQTTDERRFEMETQRSLNLLIQTRIDKKQLINSLDFDGKRLIHLVCLLSYETKIIILDEPTCYMNLLPQKYYWNILTKEKQNRAIILATFSPDEAEIIGDRIGIIKEGVLKAYGTQFFLKTKFAHHLNMTCKVTSDVSIDAITKYIKEYIPGVSPEHQIGDEIIYKLPSDKRYIYENMLVHVIRDRAQLHILDVRVFSCSIAEIYMKIGEQKSNQILNKNEPNYNVIYESASKITRQQLHAMFYKKLVYQAPTIIPLLMVLFSVILILAINPLTSIFTSYEDREYFMELGVGSNDTNNAAILQNLLDCKTILIKSLDHAQKAKNGVKHRVFKLDSFECSNRSFIDYMKFNESKKHSHYGGLEEQKNNTVWFNIRSFHSAAYSMNLAENIYLVRENKGRSFRVINKPFPTPLKLRVGILEEEMAHMRLPLTVGLVMPLVIAAFILPLVDERCKNLLILQVMAGLPMKIYWGVTFLWDMGTFLAYNIIFIIVLAFTTFEGFTFLHKIITFCLLNIYGFPALFTIYLLSLIYHKTPTRAFLVAISLQLLTGICAYVFYWEVLRTNKIFFYIASIFPTFSLLDGISNIYISGKEVDYCQRRCEASNGCTEENKCDVIPQCCSVGFMTMGSEGILVCIIYMVATGIITIILMLCVTISEKERKYTTPKNLKSFKSACNPYDDLEVIKLRKKIADFDLRDVMSYRVVVDQLEEKLTTKSKILNTVSFSAYRGQSVCVFGHRHGGKTNFVKQLIGESGYKFGEVYIEGYELKTDLHIAHSYMSYVPKDYGLFHLFSPREILRFFLMIRGVVKENIPKIIRQYSTILDMSKFMDRKIMYLSSEKKRKVNIALALAQNSTVIIMDEPTTGLSTNVCREVWLAIRHAQAMGRCIIFTSGKCLEAKNIGDDLILYQDYEMLAYGGICYLRGLYTVGFFLEIKLLRDGETAEAAEANLTKDIENLHRFVMFLHENSELRVRIDTWLKYYCPVEHIRFTVLFGALEHNKIRLNIVDYTINEGSVWDMLYNIVNARARLKNNT
ncbi:ATP-binding cassette sub-family A member 3-like [Teleopsis dalmanni]|uniref:ATP-binding cassette sub-family A member 3-like n=1 Tax=Teleopsis dalmanni TaxID=139649 RepID=UPI0018CC88AB|nr:ATP-binding cassette sub-family A member 3-like [Teleopsis dalmanni]